MSRSIRKKILAVLLSLLLAGWAGSALSQEVVTPAQLQLVSGDEQNGVVSRELDDTLQVLVSNRVAGIRVRFEFIDIPAGALGATLTPHEAVTDADGLASVKLKLGSKPGTYVVLATCVNEGRSSAVVFKVHARSEDWFIFVIFGVVGGLGVFLYGIRRMSEGFQKMAGDRIKRWLTMLTANRISGVFAGLTISAILQSSSAAAVMLIGFTGAGLISFFQALSVIIGAKIGTTITAQLVALHLTDYALLFVGVGFIFFAASKRQGYRHFGQALLGFGLLFLGIKIISETVAPLTAIEPVRNALASVQDLKTGIMIGLLFTVLVQSGGATIGVLIALSANNLINIESAIPIIFGASLGSSVTVLIASFGAKREAKRVALGHLIIATTGVLIVAPLSTYLRQVVVFLAPLPPGGGAAGDLVAGAAVAQQIAYAQLIYSLVTAVAILPFIKPLAKLIEKLLPGAPAGEKFGPQYLNGGSLKFPTLALEQAQRETIRMAGLARELVEKSIAPFISRDRLVVQELALEDDKVDILRHAITHFLTSLSQQHLTDQESKRNIALLRVVAKLEDIGDIVVREILVLANKLLNQSLHFSEEGFQQIRDFHWEVVGTLDTVITAVRAGDSTLAKRLIEAKVHIVEREKDLHRAHIERLCKGMQESFSTSSIHLDLLTNLRRINSHVVDIAYALMDERGGME